MRHKCFIGAWPHGVHQAGLAIHLFSEQFVICFRTIIWRFGDGDDYEFGLWKDKQLLFGKTVWKREITVNMKGSQIYNCVRIFI